MNEISLLFNWVIDEFAKNDFVNTISIVPTIEVDNNKENIYQLVNLDLTNSELTDQAIYAIFKVTIVQQRDKRPAKTDSKLLTDVNYIDNVNETHSTAVRFRNVVSMQNNELNIELEEFSQIRFLREWGTANLDGVQFDLTLSIPNMGSSC